MYQIDIMTLFPDVVGDMLCESILGRAQERGFIRIEAHQIRDYTANKQNQVDDYPYGGGRGAVMQADPLYQCWQHICDEVGCRPHTIYLSPCGKKLYFASNGHTGMGGFDLYVSEWNEEIKAFIKPLNGFERLILNDFFLTFYDKNREPDERFDAAFRAGSRGRPGQRILTKSTKISGIRNV